MDKRAQERVAIAQDALDWLEAGALIAHQGSYLLPERYPTGIEERSGKQLRDIVLGKCKVCVLGAMFLAKAVRFDKVLVEEWMMGASNTNDGALTQHFEAVQLKMIESHFEGWDGCYHYCVSYPDPKDRMVAILRNIIDNQGTFKP